MPCNRVNGLPWDFLSASSVYARFVNSKRLSSLGQHAHFFVVVEVIRSGVFFIVLMALWGGKEGGVDGQVSLKRFGGCSDASELSELSSPSRVLKMFCSSSSVSVLRGILSCKSSATILNAIHLLLFLSLRISTQARWSWLNSTGMGLLLWVDLA